MKSLKIEEIKRGLYVQDEEKNSGWIVECNDLAKIHVQFFNGGSGTYCLVKNNKENKNLVDKLYLFEK